MNNNSFELSINPEYVRDWGVWEAIRELIQNAKDADEKGNPLKIEYDPELQCLTLTNYGVSLEPRHLMLGTSTKMHDDSARGQFGEGFKLAWLALCRLGRSVTCAGPTYVWTPRIEWSEKYQSKALVVRSVPASLQEMVRINLEVTPEEWSQAQLRLPCLREDYSVDAGRVVLQNTEGKIYARGIWVCDLDSTFSYDLPTLKLDRDRKMADPSDLAYEITHALNDAVGVSSISGEALYNLLDSSTYESEAVRRFGDWRTHLVRAVTAEFVRRHGRNAMPCSSIGALAKAGHHGFKGVFCSEAICVLVQQELGSFAERCAQRGLEPTQTFARSELTAEELRNLNWAQRKVRGATTIKFTVKVVKFRSDRILGTALRRGRLGMNVRLARNVLLDRAQLIATLVHEVAHYAGGDGDPAHQRAIEDIFGRIVAGGK